MGLWNWAGLHWLINAPRWVINKAIARYGKCHRRNHAISNHTYRGCQQCACPQDISE